MQPENEKKNPKPAKSNKIVCTQRIRFDSDRISILHSPLQDFIIIFFSFRWQQRCHQKIISKNTKLVFRARIRIGFAVLRNKIAVCVCCSATQQNSRANFRSENFRT